MNDYDRKPQFLVRNLAGNEKSASVLLRLFKLVFGSVTLFAENEPVLQPHLATIISSAMKHATEVKVEVCGNIRSQIF